MISLDRRTRTDADVRDIDVSDFFERELPHLIETKSHYAVPGAREFMLASISFLTSAGSWTLALTDKQLSLQPGDRGRAAIQASDSDLADIINDLSTFDMLMALCRVALVRGERSEVNGWWAVLRALLDDRPVHTAGAIVLRDRGGRPLDVTRAFTLQDDDAEIAHFLAEAGFLHLSGWLGKDLMRTIADDINRVLPSCTPSDGSWWVTREDGSRQAVRIINFARHSPAVRELLASEPFQRIGRLTGDKYVKTLDVEALHKPMGLVAGTSKIGWHNDCGMGRHSYRCCQLVVGVSVTGAGPGSAQLGVVPGSHRALMPYDAVYPHTGLEALYLNTAAGDMTVHCSCTMHMAKVPTVHERKVLYTGFRLAEADGGPLKEARRAYQPRHEVPQLAG